MMMISRNVVCLFFRLSLFSDFKVDDLFYKYGRIRDLIVHLPRDGKFDDNEI